MTGMRCEKRWSEDGEAGDGDGAGRRWRCESSGCDMRARMHHMTRRMGSGRAYARREDHQGGVVEEVSVYGAGGGKVGASDGGGRGDAGRSGGAERRPQAWIERI